eukprot:3649643-Rhodomonas_salina.1
MLLRSDSGQEIRGREKQREDRLRGLETALCQPQWCISVRHGTTEAWEGGKERGREGARERRDRERRRRK